MQLLDALSDDRLSVLDFVRLVKHNVEEFFLVQQGQRLLHLLVVDDDYIVGCHLFLGELVLAFTGCGFDDTHVDSIKELFDFVLPVVGERGRTNDEAARTVHDFAVLFDLGQFDFLALVEDHREGLESLSETHIVAQGAVQVVLPKLRHPVDALLLVVSQFGIGVGLHRHDKLILRDNLVLCKHQQELQPFLRQLGKLLAFFRRVTRIWFLWLKTGDFEW